MVLEGLFYTREHEWLKIEGDEAVVGITDHAQEMLGEITFVELPPIDKEVDRGDDLAVVESSKAASDVYAPISGSVIDVNAELGSKPEIINEDCYEAGWICRLAIANKDEVKQLMDAKKYEAYLKGL
jgi:glycine cleavage system H protein